MTSPGLQLGSGRAKTPIWDFSNFRVGHIMLRSLSENRMNGLCPQEMQCSQGNAWKIPETVSIQNCFITGESGGKKAEGCHGLSNSPRSCCLKGS